MQLRYHKGENFGDALNPYIFNRFLEPYFSPGAYPELNFYGIGSILGDNFSANGKKIIFSSGYAQGAQNTYGKPPVIDSSYDVFCVRGPLTCKALNIDPRLAITDGAMLLRHFGLAASGKKYKFSYIPHVGSEAFYDWRPICEEAGIHYISPRISVEEMLSEMLASEIIITEAMHGAIVADTLRIPWIPVKAYKTINEFKWKDWTMSLNIDMEFNLMQGPFSREFISKAMKNIFPALTPGFVTDAAASVYSSMKSLQRGKKLLSDLEQLMRARPCLSDEKLLDSKLHELLSKLEEFKKKYPL